MKLSKREEIARLYERYPQPRSMEEDERLYRVSGYVIETRDVFIMGKAVARDAPEELILDPLRIFTHPDAWFLHAMAGNLLSMYAAMPYHLPYVGWARRDGPIRWHLTEEARRHISALVPMFVLWLGKRRFSF